MRNGSRLSAIVDQPSSRDRSGNRQSAAFDEVDKIDGFVTRSAQCGVLASHRNLIRPDRRDRCLCSGRPRDIGCDCNGRYHARSGDLRGIGSFSQERTFVGDAISGWVWSRAAGLGMNWPLCDYAWDGSDIGETGHGAMVLAFRYPTQVSCCHLNSGIWNDCPIAAARDDKPGHFHYWAAAVLPSNSRFSAGKAVCCPINTASIRRPKPGSAI